MLLNATIAQQSLSDINYEPSTAGRVRSSLLMLGLLALALGIWRHMETMRQS
jgi:hypothetical protein